MEKWIETSHQKKTHHETPHTVHRWCQGGHISAVSVNCGLCVGSLAAIALGNRLKLSWSWWRLRSGWCSFCVDLALLGVLTHRGTIRIETSIVSAWENGLLTAAGRAEIIHTDGHIIWKPMIKTQSVWNIQFGTIETQSVLYFRFYIKIAVSVSELYWLLDGFQHVSTLPHQVSDAFQALGRSWSHGQCIWGYPLIIHL